MELLEREQCLAELSRRLDAARGGAGSVLLVYGEAGVGKSALLRHFRDSTRHARVLWGGCDDLFAPQPLAPVYDIARQIQGPVLAAFDSGAPRSELFAALFRELAGTASVAVFEDVHWADEATLDLLKFLGRRIDSTPSMVVVSYRDDEVGPRHPLRAVIGDLPRASTHRLPIAPLSEAAVAQLAHAAGRSSEGLFRITSGNPLFLTELLATQTEDVPATVRDAVLARAARLIPESRSVAELAAVIPGRTESWLLAQVAASEAAIDGCLSIGMVLFEDGALGYRHELVRRVLEQALLPSRRQALHGLVLASLAARPDIPAARLSHHADGAGDAAGVVRFAPLAGRQASAVGAHREAVSQYQMALRHAGGLAPDDRAMLQEALAYECYLTSQHERGAEAQSAALAVWRASGLRVNEANALRWLSRFSWFAGRRTDADRYAAESIAALELLPASRELAMAYANRAQLDMEAHENASAINFAQKAVALAEQLEANEVLSDALNTLGTARLITGEAEGWTDLSRSMALARTGDFQALVARGFTNVCAMAVSRREYQKAADYLREGLAYCEQRQLDSWWLYLLAYSARLKFELSDWSGASDDADAVLRHPHSTPVTRIPTLKVLAHLRVRRGDPDAAGPLAEARALCGPIQELQRLGSLAAVEAEAAWLAGDAEGVIRAAQTPYERVSQRQDPRMKGELAIWLWRVGALAQAPTGIAQPYAFEIAGDWRAAAAMWRTLGCRYECATLFGWYGSEAEQRGALTLLHELGATPAETALRQRLRARGVRKLPRGARASTRGNRFRLTRREAEVLQLLSQGLSNGAIARRLFLSTKTIDHHVSTILAKLSVKSRAEAVVVARRGSDQVH
jgi:DNA-binding CsgD family transcriptional regulator